MKPKEVTPDLVFNRIDTAADKMPSRTRLVGDGKMEIGIGTIPSQCRALLRNWVSGSYSEVWFG